MNVQPLLTKVAATGSTITHPMDPIQKQKLSIIGQFSSLLGYYVIDSATGAKDAISHYNSHRASASANASYGSATSTVGADTETADSTTKPPPPQTSAASIIAERKTNGTYGPSGQGQQAHSLSPSTQFIANSMDRYLYRDDEDTMGVGGAIISVPALDLQSSPGASSSSSSGRVGGQQHQSSGNMGVNNSNSISSNSRDSNASSILPSIGESANGNLHANVNANRDNSGTATNGNSNTPNNAIPVMVASVLGHCNTNHHLSTPTTTPTKPSNSGSTDPLQLDEASSKATGIEYAATSNLGRPISYTRSSAPHAPGAMARTISDSFSSLVEARLRAWTLLLLRHSLSRGDEDSRTRLMSLLAANKIHLSAIVTTFRVDTSSTVAGAVTNNNGKNNKCGTAGNETKINEHGNGKYSRENCDYILPLTMEVNIDLKSQDKVISLHLTAPGTVAAAFHNDSDLLTYFQCQIDTNSLVTDMIAQARLVALKAVAKATTCNPNHLRNRIETEQTLSQFGSSLNLSTVGVGGAMGGASVVDSSMTMATMATNTSSASAREESNGIFPSMNSSISGSSGSQRNLKWCKNTKPTKVSKESVGNLTGTKRTRSVTWDNSVNDLTRVQSVLKKPKRLNSLKRSIVSFGKPNSGFFQSAKNATFAEFGNLTKNPNVARVCPISGRIDAAPKPHQSTMNLSARHSLSMGKNLNASFTPNQPSQSPSLLSSSTGIGTPTLLSSHALLRKPTFTELARSAKYSQDRPRRPENSLLSLTNKGLSFSAHNNLKRTPTQLEDLLIKRTRGSEFNRNSSGGSGGGNANWG
eukprot:CAMPEP_0203668516 /NCGR_PEP_ID=MMETSP0090-20130426/5126_1 /ASSEMBLY_ACC=CAM_ASM_001088 /TAXON_ID=426623 /ORGANISM="Chaetoceros affinis, Strain CCMP159" /LENGTH=811 /DNA_ID=CAMNT_0050532975 /DNA_START=269 /DNA_END=2704 /DNA_ORIENTATION=+